MKLYDILPSVLKSWAVAGAALLNNQKKYGADYDKSLKYLLETEPEKQQQDAKEKLTKCIKVTSNSNPVYNLSPDADLNDLPLIDKGFLRENYQYIIASTPFKIVKSSGTTGEPFAMPYNKHSYQLEYAFWWYHRSFGGIEKGERTATVLGHRIIPINRKKPPFWIFNHLENQLLLSSYHLSMENLNHYIDALNKFKPKLIHAYPSSIYLIARYILENNIQLNFRPKMIQTASETTLSFQRDVIEKAFGCKVYIWYGNTEYAGHITEWPDGKLRVQPWHSFVRIVDDHGKNVAMGEEGYIVATNFHNTTFPIVNYNTKDKAIFGGYDTNGFMLINQISGRIEDYIITTDGRYVGRLDHLFKDAKYVRNAQLEQRKIGEIIIRIEKEELYNTKIEQVIKNETLRRLGKKTTINFEYVRGIPKNKNGKFKFIIQSLDMAKMNSGVKN
jgi:phenylacetate-CoA ligase